MIEATYRAEKDYVVFDTRRICYYLPDGDRSCLTMNYGKYRFEGVPYALEAGSDEGKRARNVRKAAALAREASGALRAGKIEAAVREVSPLKPRAMIEYLDLLRPIFQKTARHGHFGRSDPDFTWEGTGRAEALGAACG